MKKTDILKKLGEKMANLSVDPRCAPLLVFQPEPPAKIKEKMQQSK